MVAPPGRTRATARMRQQGNSLSRPSSVHVDDFQRGVGGKQEVPVPRSGGPGRAAQPGGPGQRAPPHAPLPGGPSLQKLLSDPAVVAVGHTSPTQFRLCLSSPQTPQQSHSTDVCWWDLFHGEKIVVRPCTSAFNSPSCFNLLMATLGCDQSIYGDIVQK